MTPGSLPADARAPELGATRRKTIFLFSGQGSQYFQMGRRLYDQNATFRAAVDPLDRQARSLLGTSVLAALYGTRGKAELFDDIRLTHPAIFMVEYALARTLIGMGIKPDCTFGASLGSVCALVVAERLRVEDGLDLVLRQALTIEKHCPRGGMIAVLGSPRIYHESAFLRTRAVIAGRNLAAHFVLSTPQPHLAAVEHHLTGLGVAYQTLPVRFPFHSAWMEPMRQALREACGEPAISAAGLPMLCCARGGFLGDIDSDYFWEVARSEIAFIRAVEEAERSGPCDYLDLGPTGTLATFLKYLLPANSESRSQAAITPYACELESLKALRAQWSVASDSASAEV